MSKHNGYWGWWRDLPMSERKHKLQGVLGQAYYLWERYPSEAEKVVPTPMLRLLPSPEDDPLWLGRERQWQVYRTCEQLINGMKRRRTSIH